MSNRMMLLAPILLVAACSATDTVADGDGGDDTVADAGVVPGVDAAPAVDEHPVVSVTLPGTGEHLDVRFSPPSTAEIVRAPSHLRVLVDAPMDEHIMGLPGGPTRADKCAAFVASAATPELMVDARQLWAFSTAQLEFGPRDPRVRGLVADALDEAGVMWSGPLELRWPALEPVTTAITFATSALAPLVPAANTGTQVVSEVDAAALHAMIVGGPRYDEVTVPLRIATICDLEHGLVTAVGASAPEADISFELVLR